MSGSEPSSTRWEELPTEEEEEETVMWDILFLNESTAMIFLTTFCIKLELEIFVNVGLKTSSDPFFSGLIRSLWEFMEI